MVQITFNSSFKRDFKKKIKGNQNIEVKYWEKINLFLKNPFDPQLRTHKLSGKLEELWSFTIDYDLRVESYFLENDRVVFINIGKHDEVY